MRHTVRVAAPVPSPKPAPCRNVCGDEWTLEQLEQWAQDKEKALEALYHTSTVPYGPDEAQIKRHLVHCLEMHYGDLSTAIVQPDEAVLTLHRIAELTQKYR